MDGAESENLDTSKTYLKNVFSEDEIATIPNNCINKLCDHIESLHTEKADVYAQLEKRSVESEDTTLQLQSCQERIRVLENTESTLTTESVRLRNTNATLQKEKTELEASLVVAEDARKSMADVLERIERELTDSKDTGTQMKEKLQQLTVDVFDKDARLVEFQSKITHLQTQLQRKESECCQLIEERNALDSEKLNYMRQNSRLQMDKSAELSNFQHTLAYTKAELDDAEKFANRYKNQMELVTERLRTEQDRHKECRDNFIASEESHRQELSAQRRLTDMYKEAEQKASTELTELHKTAEEYKSCLLQLTKEHEEAISAKLSEVSELKELVNAKDEHIIQIQSELKKMNELMQESSEISLILPNHVA